MQTETAWKLRRVVLSVLFLLFVALPLYPELYGLEAVTPLAQLVAFRPQALGLVLLIGLVMLVRRGWRLAAVLVTLLALAGMGLVAPRVFSDPTPPPPGSRALTIMVANVLGGGADAGEVAKLIREQRPDLVSLPEAQVDVRQEIEDHLQGMTYHGYTQQANAAAESATSVLVSSSMGDVHFDSEKLDTGKVNSAQLKPGAGEPGAETIGPVQQTSTQFGHIIVTGGTLGNLRMIVYHGYPPLPSEVSTWKRDLEVVKRWCGQDQLTILAGDFNASSDHYDFRQALGDRCRSVAPSGRMALARTQIDHVVISDGIKPGKFTTYKISGTDHRAVIANVAVPKP